MADLAKLTVRLEAESSKLRTELEKANKKLDKFDKGTKKVVSNIKRQFAGLAGLFGVGLFTGLVKQSLDAADEVQKLSQRLGASTEALSEYKHVADLSGVSFKTLTMGWQRMTRRISEAAKDTGEAKNALKELGLEAKTLNKLKPEQQFEILADALMNVKGEADRVRLAMKLFDSEGVALLQTMQGGSEAIRQMREEAKRLGLSIDQDMADSSARAKDALTKLAAGTKALGLVFVRILAPSITYVIEWLQNNLPAAVDVAGRAFQKLQEYVARVAQGTTKALSYAETVFAELARAVGMDEVAASFDAASKMYAEMADNWESVAQEVNGRIKNQEAMAKGLEIGISFNQLYNAALAESIEKEQQSKGIKTKLSEEQKELNRLMEEGKRIAEEMQTPQERFNAQVMHLNDLLDIGAINWDTYNRQMLDYQLELEKATATTEKVIKKQAKETNDMAKELGMTFSSAFEDALVNGKKLSDVLKGLEQDIIRIITRQLITKPLANAIGGIDFGSILGNIFGGARANGGPVMAGTPYMVGEKGPELFIPNTAGSILSNNQMAGVTVVNNISVQAPSGRVSKESLQQLQASAGLAVRRAIRRNA